MRIFVCNKNYSKTNFFNINSYIEVDGNIVKEKIYFEFYDSYKRLNSIKIALNINDVWCVIYAIKALLKYGSTDYKKITGGNNPNKKILSFNENYINASFQSIKIGIKFNKYEFLGLIEELTSIIKETEKHLFEIQRKIKQEFMQ